MEKVYVIKHAMNREDALGSFGYNEVLGVCSSKDIAKEHIKAYAETEKKIMDEEGTECYIRDDYNGWLIELVGPNYEQRYCCEEFELNRLTIEFELTERSEGDDNGKERSA